MADAASKRRAVETLSPHFRRADFEGDTLRDVAWVPGQKVQVATGAGLTVRTYAPIAAQRGY